MSEYIDFPSTNFGLYVDATNILQYTALPYISRNPLLFTHAHDKSCCWGHH